MPTSTLWRRRRQPYDSADPRAVSPTRPSTDFIERLSPDPTIDTFSPAALSAKHTSTDPSRFIRGLGLSDIGGLEQTRSTLQPDHLFLDQTGAAHVGARPVDPFSRQAARAAAAVHDVPFSNATSPPDARRPRGRGHTRSGSTIDDLASAAIATSPSGLGGKCSPFARDGPSASTRPSTSYTRRFDPDEALHGPPAKRIKSERLPAHEWSPGARSVATRGPDNGADITHEDALLLLGLKNEVNFKNETPKLGSVPHHARKRSSIAGLPAEPWGVLEPATTDTVDLEKKPTDQGPQESHAVPGPSHVPHVAGADHTAPWQNGNSAPPHLGEAEDQKIPEPATNQANGSQPPGGPERVKKQRRIKPDVQAEVCAACRRLQLEKSDGDGSVMFWISCNACSRWFHAECAGFKTKAEARSVDKYLCKDCEPVHGKTTFVRKSSRPRTAIDYAGLNQGLVKSSAETSTHHYIQPIKEGRITLQPDDFARIRPELLTMEFIENFEGMKRPFIVPACWNPRFGVCPPSMDAPDQSADGMDTEALGGAAETSPRTDSYAAVPEVVESEVVDCDQDLLDMVIPRDLTVRKVAQLYGLEEPVPVIDVKSQETKGHFTLRQWADYYELPGDKPIRNVISLEVSQSPLGKLIRRPKVVRDLDLEDHVWELDAETRTKKRPVQFYCLMSVADSYTDFHIDFGGSSVYYHIIKGTKTFFFIPPEDKYLKKYEDWCNSDSQNETWLGDLCGGNCTRIDLHEGDTAFIPAGWIHSVWTPEDSLVIGGNFLTRLDYEMQLKVANVEKVTKVAPKFRYPYFQKVMWYTLIKYLEDDPVPDDVLADFRDDRDYMFLRANPVWHEVGELENTAEPGTAEHHARFYPQAEIAGLPALRDYLYRTARIDAGFPVPDITKKQIDAVKASIPKGCGDPMALIKTFAIWCAWKIGNVLVPDWVHSDGAVEHEKAEKNSKPEPLRLPGERSSSRKALQAQALARAQSPFPNVSVVITTKPATTPSPPQAGALKMACEPCRKRRIKCRHKLGHSTPADGATPTGASATSNGGTPQPWAALPNASSAEHMPSPNAPVSEDAGDTAELAPAVPMGADVLSSSKKSRTKACEECRKSKRRCVHDENGHVDPAKAAEPSRPRVSISSKRPEWLGDETSPTKRPRTQSGPSGDLDNLVLTNGDVPKGSDEAIEDDSGTPTPTADEEPRTYPSNVAATGNLAYTKKPTHGRGLSSTSGGSAQHANTGDAKIKTEGDAAEHDSRPRRATSLKQTTPKPKPTTEESSNWDAGEPGSPTPQSRHSSRTSKRVDRYKPDADDQRSPSKAPPTAPSEDRRASSAASAQTAVTSGKSRRSSSNTSGTTHQMAAMMSKRSASREATAGRPVSQGSLGGESDLDADEKFARELQAAENGLRRRSSMRV